MTVRGWWGGVVLAALVLLAAVIAGLNLLFPDEPSPSLLAGLPRSDLAVQRATTPGLLEARARARLPPGSPEREALALMAAQGFREERTDPEGVRWFRFRGDNFPCEESYRIGWTTDAAGRIGTVRTDFHSTCLER